MVSIAMIKCHDQKATWGGERFVSFVLLRYHSIYGGVSGQELKQGRKLEAGTEAGHGGTLLSGLLCLAYPACLLIAPRNTSPGWHCPQ